MYLTKMSARDCGSPSELVQVLNLLSHPITTDISFVSVDMAWDGAFLLKHLYFAPDERPRIPSLQTRYMALLRAKAKLCQQQIQT
jgi:hypothetical protein